MRGIRHFALGCTLALSALALTPGSSRAAEKAAGPTVGKPDKVALAHDKAQLAFQRDLVSVLAPRADATPLLAAALLARPLHNQPRTSSFHDLIERAASASDAGAAVEWLRLADCQAQADNCPNPAALQALVLKAPDNAAVWLLKLGQDTRNMRQQDVRTDLSRAAAASTYDDYTGSSLKALADYVSVLPPPASSYAHGLTAGPAGLQTMLVYGLASAQPQPVLPLVAQLCDNARDDASIKADCLKLGKVLEWGSSPLAQSLGLHLRQVLSDDPAQQQEAKRARIDLIWQVQNFAELTARARSDKALARNLLALARSGGTEMSIMLAALREAGIAADAPADWKPPQPAS
ncbi:MAG: hypothetical protein EPN74_13590 [Rhodanobacter sp.]|nr:MAG: hypothetical protein EPN74_13590 [Rhodanobacter sp.]